MTQGNEGYGQQPEQYGQRPGQYGPSYADPQYGPGAYGQPAGGPDGRPSRRFGVVGLVFVVLGAVALALALFVFKWFRSGSGNGDFFRNASGKSSFSDLHDAFGRANGALGSAGATVTHDAHFGVSRIYFGWLGYVLAAAVIVLALIALLPSGASAFFRPVALIAGLAGAAISVWALDLLRFTGQTATQAKSAGLDVPSFTDYLKHSGLGAWLAVAGFIVVGIGGVIGPRKVR